MRSFVAALVCILVSVTTAARESEPGVVVESVTPGGAAATAGLAPGDVLVAWSRAASPPANPVPVSGRFRSPFDVREVEIHIRKVLERSLLKEENIKMKKRCNSGDRQHGDEHGGRTRGMPPQRKNQ